MIIIKSTSTVDIPSTNIFKGAEDWCVVFNRFCETIFLYLKFIIIFIFLTVGILTILKYRGYWLGLKFKEKKPKSEEDKKNLEKIKEPNVILGIVYIALAIGILFNYFIYFLIWLLEPLPDAFIFEFLNFYGLISDEYIGRISNLNNAKYPHERTIYYCIAYFSLGGFVDLILGIRNIVIYSNSNHKISFELIITGLIMCTFAGFTTFMYLFI